MKRFVKSRPTIVLSAIVVVAALATVWAVGAVRAKVRVEHEVAKMTSRMKTVCVGRFLMDLPEEARIALTEQRIGGFDVETLLGETEDEFWERVARREANIRSTPDRLGGNRNLETVREVKSASGLVGKIFVHGRTVDEGTAAEGLELVHYRYEGVAVEALVHANGVTISLSADHYEPKLIGNMPKLVEKLVVNPGNNIPSEAGYCMDRAYFRDPLSADLGEQITMIATLPSHPDVQWMLMLMAGTKPDEKGLLQRGRESDDRLPPGERTRITKLRAAPRTIAGLNGDELVERFAEANHAIGYGFWWEVNGTVDNVFAPHFTFTMDTGRGNREPVPSSLSEGAALGLWDKITSSIRVRPTAASTLSVGPPAQPIGTVALAGESCPESGWWGCADSGGDVRVLGGQRQFIQKGSTMPQALLLPPQTLWEKLRGIQPSFESKNRTSWKLVDRRSQQRTAPVAPLVEAGAPTTASESTSSDQATLGTVVSTGTSCPASGWWRCEEANSIDGTRWFARGRILPLATIVLAARTTSPAVIPSTIQRRANWRLVRHARAPGADSMILDGSRTHRDS